MVTTLNDFFFWWGITLSVGCVDVHGHGCGEDDQRLRLLHGSRTNLLEIATWVAVADDAALMADFFRVNRCRSIDSSSLAEMWYVCS